MIKEDYAMRIASDGAKYRARTAREARAPFWTSEEAGVEKKVWNTGRIRGLAAADKRFQGDLTRLLSHAGFENGQSGKILEIGCGYGRALLDITCLAGDQVSLTGINLEHWYDSCLVKEFAADQGFTSDQAARLDIIAHDVDRGLPFPEADFDLVFSVATMHSVRDKIGLLKDINRVLCESGMAIIDLSLPRNELIKPDMRGTPMPEQFRDRLEIWSSGKKISVHDWLDGFDNIRVAHTQTDSYIVMTRDPKFTPEARLVASIPLHDIYESWWGYQSIYKLPDQAKPHLPGD